MNLESESRGTQRWLEVYPAALRGSALAGASIDCVIHNAGSINGTRAVDAGSLMDDQKLPNVTSERMLAAYQLNTLGPLRVHQALAPQIKAPGGKVVIVSTGMGSIGDNGSGGVYAYRASKAAVNMVAKGMSCDLKAEGIAVLAINPNMVVTDFGPGQEMMKKWGAITVEMSVNGLLKAIDDLTLDTTGRFMTVPKDGSPPCDFPGGW